MLQNTAQLPTRIWGNVEQDFMQLRDIVQQGNGIAFSMGDLDKTLKNRFQSYADFQNKRLTGKEFSDAYRSWSDTNRDTILGTLKAAGLTAEQFETEESTMAQLRSQSTTADGQMQALQITHQIAAQQVGQVQKLRALISQQITMTGTWYQAEQTTRDQAQAENERYFGTPSGVIQGDGKPFKPEW